MDCMPRHRDHNTRDDGSLHLIKDGGAMTFDHLEVEALFDEIYLALSAMGKDVRPVEYLDGGYTPAPTPRQ